MKQETQHTSGPWNVTPKKDSFGISITKNGRSIATIGGNTKTPYEQSMADAHLISAAPELLEACLLTQAAANVEFSESAVNIMVRAGWSERSNLTAVEFANIKVREAIAKAEGK